MTAPRLLAFHRGYHAATKRAGQVRLLHILRPELVNGSPHALCHIHAWDCQQSPRVDLPEFPATPPEGLSWCPRCLGMAAERLGLAQRLASMIQAALSVTTKEDRP